MASSDHGVATHSTNSPPAATVPTHISSENLHHPLTPPHPHENSLLNYHPTTKCPSLAGSDLVNPNHTFDPLPYDANTAIHAFAVASLSSPPPCLAPPKFNSPPTPKSTPLVAPMPPTHVDTSSVALAIPDASATAPNVAALPPSPPALSPLNPIPPLLLLPTLPLLPPTLPLLPPTLPLLLLLTLPPLRVHLDRRQIQGRLARWRTGRRRR
jgi:hypothetical protein